MIPADAIVEKNMNAGTPDAIDTAWIKHVSGDNSHLTLKSYEQGREGFDGDAIHVIWLDEEPELPIYTECLLRTMTTKGIVYVTFTPLQGISDVVKQFLYPNRTRRKSSMSTPRGTMRRTWTRRRRISIGPRFRHTNVKRAPKVSRTSAPARSIRSPNQISQSKISRFPTIGRKL